LHTGGWNIVCRPGWLASIGGREKLNADEISSTSEWPVVASLASTIGIRKQTENKLKQTVERPWELPPGCNSRAPRDLN
jgi:hypothetical protein